MASAILRSAGPLRHRVPRLLSSTARSTPRALEEERLLSSCAAGRSYTKLNAEENPCEYRYDTVSTTCSAYDMRLGKVYSPYPMISWKCRRETLVWQHGSSLRTKVKHPCKLNRGRKGLVWMDGQLESINKEVQKDVRGWRELREELEQNQIKRAELYKQQDRVVAYASAAVALALVAANFVRSG